MKFIKVILVTYVLKKHRQISLERRENTGNLILIRTWPITDVSDNIVKTPNKERVNISLSDAQAVN